MCTKRQRTEVERKLREKIRQGYLPERSIDGCSDHYCPDGSCDWFQISEHRFREIVKSELLARKQRMLSGRKG